MYDFFKIENNCLANYLKYIA